MASLLSVGRHMYASIWSHLLESEREEAAFILAEAQELAGVTRFTGKDVYLVPHEDLQIHASCHIALSDEAQEKVLMVAWQRRLALVELHSHLGEWPAAFSPSDLLGLSEFAPHAIWRLGQPYLALVVTQSEFDAVFWATRDGLAGSLEAIEVDGKVYRPSGRTIKSLLEKRSG